MKKLQHNEYILYAGGVRTGYQYFNATLGRIPVCDVYCQRSSAKNFTLTLKEKAIFTGIGEEAGLGQFSGRMISHKLTSNSAYYSGQNVEPNAWQDATPRIIIEDMCRGLDLQLEITSAPQQVLGRFSVGRIHICSALDTLVTVLAHYGYECTYFFNAEGKLVFGNINTMTKNIVYIHTSQIVQRGAHYIDISPEPIVYGDLVRIDSRLFHVESVVHQLQVGAYGMCRIYFKRQS